MAVPASRAVNAIRGINRPFIEATRPACPTRTGTGRGSLYLGSAIAEPGLRAGAAAGIPVVVSGIIAAVSQSLKYRRVSE
jgi:hypothetical protein